MASLLILLIAAYLAGSINFSIGLFKLLGKEDPRRHFSKNPGVTNVYRQAGPLWALVVLLLETVKAVAVAWAATRMLIVDYQTLVGLALIIGNRYPCFHRFQGGKGVANYLGFTCVLAPLATGVALIVYGIFLWLSRTPFIASFFMVAVLAGGTIQAVGFNLSASAATVATAVFIVYCHKSNLIEFFNRPSLK